MKLQQGDYVEGLTEEQFDELMELQPSDYLSYFASCQTDKYFIPKSLVKTYAGLNHTRKDLAITKLSFTEFKQRAINTFEL